PTAARLLALPDALPISLLAGSAHAFVDGLPLQAKIPADVREVFRVPGEQQPPVFQHRDKPLQDARLGGFIEINHNVAAENRIKADRKSTRLNSSHVKIS